MLMVPFMDPVFLEKMKQRRVSVALMNKKPFDQIKPPRRYSTEDVGIIASTFKPNNPLEEFFPDVGKDGVLDPTGNLKYVKLPLPVGVGLPIASAKDIFYDSARAFFDEQIDVPALHFKTDYHPGWDVWMSLTPNEMWTLRSGVKAATGNVVLGGLGMGWMLVQIAAKRTVRSITVVERDSALLNWFGRELCSKFEKVTLVEGDVFKVAEECNPDTTRFILDVWPSCGTSAWDGRVTELRQRARYVWAWGSPKGGK